MKKIAPEVFRQRLLVEGYYTRTVDENAIRMFFKEICADLNLRTYADPIIFQPSSLGKEDNAGYDAFVPLIDSGISLYVWSGPKFISIILYTCKGFDEAVATEKIKTFFGVKEPVVQSF